MISIQPQQAPQFGRPKVTTQGTVLFASNKKAAPTGDKKNPSIVNTKGTVVSIDNMLGIIEVALHPEVVNRYKVDRVKRFSFGPRYSFSPRCAGFVSRYASFVDSFKIHDEISLVLQPYKKMFGLLGRGYKVEVDYDHYLKKLGETHFGKPLRQENKNTET